MKEKITKRNDETVIEVRSEGGRLLFIKTKNGYEMKCPRTKKIYLVKYEDMLGDYFEAMEVLKTCLKALEDNFRQVDQLLKKSKSTKSFLTVLPFLYSMLLQFFGDL
jgi:glutaredoxin 2